ncbi:NAD-dependent epimerase/dehydratase family protein [Bacteroidota bacterium]
MNIAITGGSGLIGKTIINSYANQHSFVILGRNGTNKWGDQSTRYIQTDYSIKSLKEQLNNIDGIIHLAAIRQQSRNQQLSIDSYLTNIKLSANVFEACKELGIKNVSYTSSHSVYGSTNEDPYNEDQKVSPETIYGLSKYTNENLANYYNDKFKMSIKSLRIASVFGLRDYSDLFNTFINSAIKKKAIKVKGDGSACIAYIYVKDAVTAIMDSLLMIDLKGTINIGTGKDISILSLAQNINYIFDNRENIVYLKNKEFNYNEAIMDINKAFKLLNWEPKWPLSLMLEDVKQSYFKRVLTGE